MKYTYTPSAPENEMFHCEKKHIRHQSAALAEERLEFLDGTAVGELDIFDESGRTVRMVRRIIEKRVCQDLHRRRRARSSGNYDRFIEKRRIANQMKNIYGRAPVGFDGWAA